MSKIKLSDTIHFLPATEDSPNDSPESKITISIDPGVLQPGGTLHAHIHCAFSADSVAPEAALDYLAVSLEGQILTSLGSTPFVHAAEIEHGRPIRSQTGFTLPTSIRIPHTAIASSPGATWTLSVRVVWQNVQMLQAQTDLSILPASQT